MDFEKAVQFIWGNARLLERAVYAYRFEQAPAERILSVLKTYQDADGGFGQALEPDLRAPQSQPLFVEFGLRLLYECKLRDAELAYRVCDFLALHADLQQGIPTIFPSSQNYPRAAHWNDPGAQQRSLDRLIGLVGLANWQGIQHPWLQQAVESCFETLIKTHYTEAHTLQNAFCLLESLPDRPETPALFDRLGRELLKAEFFCAEAPVSGYCLTPLHFASRPDSFCRRLFTEKQLDGHLKQLEGEQDQDGGWPIAWQPPSEAAKCEWRAFRTLDALSTLHAYGRI